ncbi:D-alanyl-D-alanine carboxypeptidase/D-alanyl-D-alanine endopeptidase [Chamaesiphon polymorphus]|uniref:D-alanyl-D-alanine carboxypeptidase/D-alanyl-D-alanine-endopeptidase n=1 Tax=Chamaesiphon polymorphus CCALA 037 TaxID=2107692 RepID=A0A2T1GAD3_9CYAN|nr:D-alanyl-D-alanine carboxypeptidase/D-alanyl-D-alanine-endopeptidase [Chamaesiphon polymorphus]PSB54227.1 D-alanyl-D-alanine carboxypeptidase/D-alanyl-D-alanine-endopeptidase [Chamaesiphon polymorphus CCALA 037]
MQQLFLSRQRVATACGWLLMQLSIAMPTLAQSQVAPPPALPAVCSSQLTTAINAIVDRPELRRYRWGIVIQALNGTSQLYNRDGDRLFIPASNVKLITTAVALRQLGAPMRLRTSVYQLPSTGNKFNLLVVGRGDPSLTVTGLDSIAQQLKQQGRDRIGQISFDDGYFRGEPINGDWEWGDLSTDYAPPINGLMLGQNSNPLVVSSQQIGMPLTYTWKDPSLNNWQVENQSITAPATEQNTVNASAIFGKSKIRLTGKLALNATPTQIDLPLVNPAESFSTAFRQSLYRSGITIDSTQVVSGQNIVNLSEIAAINSPPIAELINETNQKSNNVYAEVLLKSIGRTHPEHFSSSQDTSTLGIALFKQNLTAMGVDPQAYSLRDGSGLSRHNLVAPTAFVRVLSAMAISPTAQIYRESLPVAGISGSLKNRMKGTLAQGIVKAKTGSLSGVASLSGYINPPQYSPLVFSIMLNQHDRPTSQMVKVIDEIMVVLARLKQC